MRNGRNERDVAALIELWSQIGRIRTALLDRVRRAEEDRRRAARDIAILRADGGGIAAQKLAELVDGEVAAAEAAVLDLDQELAKRLKRAEPPWALPARFADLAIPGIAHERRLAFERAIDVVRKLADEQRARLRREGWSSGMRMPAPISATPDTPGFEWLGAAGSALLRAREVQFRFRGETAQETELADACRHIVREVQSEHVADVLLGTAKGHGASSRSAAAEIVAKFVGLTSGSAVLKATKADVSSRRADLDER